MKYILLFALSLSYTFFNSQTKFDAGSGKIKKIAPWGEGTLVVKSPSFGANESKVHLFSYYDENGKRLWESEIKPYNTYNYTISYNNSKYAYLVNLSAFKATSIYEKADKENPLRINKIDREGKVKEIILTQEQINPIKAKSISKIVMGVASENKLVLILKVNSDENKNIEEYYSFLLDENEKIKINKIKDLKTDENKSYKEDSEPKLIYNDNEKLIITHTKFDKQKFILKTYQISLNDLSIIKEISSNIILDKIPEISFSLGLNSINQNLGAHFQDYKVDFGELNGTLQSFFSTKIIDNNLIVYGNISDKLEVLGIWYSIYDLNGEEVQNNQMQTIFFKSLASFPKNVRGKNEIFESFNANYIDEEVVFMVKLREEDKYYKIINGKGKIFTEFKPFSNAVSYDPIISKKMATYKMEKWAFMYYHNFGKTNFYFEKNGEIVLFQD
ncbi:MAG: hypothetical protein V4622_00475 [Bacteroidota bacterium]